MSPPSLECHPHHCPIQASDLAETRNEKAAFLSMALLPITLKKGILLGEKTPGDLSVWKGKGHSEQRPRDSHLFSQASSFHLESATFSPPVFVKATTRPVASKCAFRGSRCSMSSRSSHDPLTCSKCRSMFQVYLPSCMFVIVSWVSFMVKPEVVPGR